MTHLSLLLDRLGPWTLADGIKLLADFETRWPVERIFCRQNWQPPATVDPVECPFNSPDSPQPGEPEDDHLDCTFGRQELFGQPDWSQERDDWYKEE
ncbi:MAG: hypothetical protein A2589_02780 [Candidatus Vogelbacteria bacterium RIFOXYD1_FULL_46_19]|uniref:Uncharacterized protein n=1 Tax=Candidatus Vogelbacteria bacterium RIFOXYD1_FULL_46_19 TaxID=1802439 RepID=A0A1G2QH83_9BACT|nr:MAG: hypothetical protein A2589_02780 [Candidatus Vogelbacteria bacterium RIFOXYD1_FULL_46_19]